MLELNIWKKPVGQKRKYGQHELIEAFIVWDQVKNADCETDYYGPLLKLLSRLLAVDLVSKWDTQPEGPWQLIRMPDEGNPEMVSYARWRALEHALSSYKHLSPVGAGILADGYGVIPTIETEAPNLKKHYETYETELVRLIEGLFGKVYGISSIVVDSDRLRAEGFDDSKPPYPECW